MAVDLSQLLARKADEIEKPSPMPVGHYGFTVMKYEAVESGQKKTPGVEFTVVPFESKEDVDADELAKVKDPFKRNMRLTFWITEDSLFRLKDFFVKLGMDVAGREMGELVAEAIGQQFIAAVVHEQSTRNPEEVFANINDNSVAAYE